MYKVTHDHNAFVANLTIPDALKAETYERRTFEGSFHRLNLAIRFHSGNDGVGAVVKHFIDAIPNHDKMVKRVEDSLLHMEGLKSVLKKKNCLFKNLDSSFNTLLTNPDELDEYMDLIPKMKNIDARIKAIRQTEARVKAELERVRFLELDATCRELLKLQESLLAARDCRDETRAELTLAEQEHNKIMALERRCACKISDDHVIADEKGVLVADIFPNIQKGYILTEFNYQSTENLKFDTVLAQIRTTKPPHRAVFKRYDYKCDQLSGDWTKVNLLRDEGVCIEDPRISRIAFVNAAARGDIKTVTSMLQQGEDPNSYDHVHLSAVHAAAANDFSDVVELLHKSGANIDALDKNKMTPLLTSVRRGGMDMIRMLMDLGADRHATDKLHRNALFFAVCSGNVNAVRVFLKQDTCNLADEYWGFTPLHMAANKGSTAVVKMLLDYGASVYRKSKKGKTAEQVALQGEHLETMGLLRDERLSAPAQLVHLDDRLGVGYWIGDQTALEPNWRSEVNISVIICILTPSHQPPPKSWMAENTVTKVYVMTIDIDDDDDTTPASWTELEKYIPDLMMILADSAKTPDAQILIVDSTGISTCAAILAACFIIRLQYRFDKVVTMIAEARPVCQLSLSMRRGLDRLQVIIDDKKMKRLNRQVRTSTILSLAF